MRSNYTIYTKITFIRKYRVRMLEILECELSYYLGPMNLKAAGIF